MKDNNYSYKNLNFRGFSGQYWDVIGFLCGMFIVALEIASVIDPDNE
jgi:hypothetical protein